MVIEVKKKMADVQRKPEQALSPLVQQQMGLLNLRAADLMNQINVVIKSLLDELAVKDAKIVELQAPVKEKQK